MHSGLFHRMGDVEFFLGRRVGFWSLVVLRKQLGPHGATSVTKPPRSSSGGNTDGLALFGGMDRDHPLLKPGFYLS